MESRDCVLLLTATVAPHPGLPGVVLRDPSERLRRYAENLQYWLRNGPRLRAIAFAENSGADLTELSQVVAQEGGRRPVELLSVPGNDYPGEFGKGYGELILIDDALQRSKHIFDDTLVVKVTGLQRVLNLAGLITSLPDDTRWAVDLKRHRLYELCGLDWSGRGCDTRCFFVNTAFFRRELSALMADHREGEFYLEGAFFHKAEALERREGIVLRFAIEPRFSGLSGHWGKDYDSPGQRLKYWIRAMLRRTLPDLWV